MVSVIATLVLSLLVTQTTQTFYVNNSVTCSDTTAGGTQAQPYCTLRYVSTIAKPGDTFLISSKRDGSGPVVFTRPGTAAAPITYKAVGDVVIGSFIDLNDEDFKPTALPNVYELSGVPITATKVWQTFYDPIVVDDSNTSKFTMVDTDGPLVMSQAPDEATLIAHEGMYRRDSTTGMLRVHPYGNRKPSTTATDLVIGNGVALQVDTKAQYNVFDGFRITYTGSIYTGQVSAPNVRLLNMTYQGQPLSLRGANSVLENISITHVLERRALGKWSWFTDAIGTAGGAYGPGHRVKNIHVWHNWNSSFSGEDARGIVVDGARMHGAPNHCTIVAKGDATIRNATLYNCQDTQWMNDTAGLTMEHVTIGGGVAISAVTRTLGPIFIRNSIVNGRFSFVRGPATLPREGCTWEKDSIVEHSVLSETATVRHCADKKEYPIKTYIEKCDAGEWIDPADGKRDCVTFRNNVYFTSLSEVINGGPREPDTDEWDTTLTSGSPAIDLGMPTSVTTDYAGVSRPQGQRPDAGMYESVNAPKPVDCVVSPWGAWTSTSSWQVANWSQSRPEQRSRTVITPAANGGQACPVLVESRTASQACASVTLTPALAVTCNVAEGPTVRKE